MLPSNTVGEATCSEVEVVRRERAQFLSAKGASHREAVVVPSASSEEHVDS